MQLSQLIGQRRVEKRLEETLRQPLFPHQLAPHNRCLFEGSIRRRILRRSHIRTPGRRGLEPLHEEPSVQRDRRSVLG